MAQQLPKYTFEPATQATTTVLVIGDEGKSTPKEVTEDVDPLTRLSFVVPTRDEIVVIEEWPYTTDDIGIVNHLQSHHLVDQTGYEEPEPHATNGAVTKAESLGVDLKQVHGTGKDGQIITEDVVNHAKQNPAVTDPPPEELEQVQQG